MRIRIKRPRRLLMILLGAIACRAISQVAAPDGGTAPEAPRASFPFGPPVDIELRHTPAPAIVGGRTHLVYELQITNLGGQPLSVERIEVLGDGRVLATYADDALMPIILPTGAPPAGWLPGTPLDARRIEPGRRAVASLWVTLDVDTAVPAALAHRVVVAGHTLETSAMTVDAQPPLVLAPPLRGGPWVAANGPSNASTHRRAPLVVYGRLAFAQRFAIDWLKLDSQESRLTGDPANNASYHAYGEEVLAVADGVVAAVTDGIAENTPSLTERAVPITLETIAGNSVTLDLGGGRFAVYAHLQPNSLRVRERDRVRRGEVLGLLGNSGNSTEPHLHFHVANRPEGLAGEGVPYVIDAFTSLDSSTGSSAQRTRELPGQNAVVVFP